MLPNSQTTLSAGHGEAVDMFLIEFPAQFVERSLAAAPHEEQDFSCVEKVISESALLITPTFCKETKTRQLAIDYLTKNARSGNLRIYAEYLERGRHLLSPVDKRLPAVPPSTRFSLDVIDTSIRLPSPKHYQALSKLTGDPNSDAFYGTCKLEFPYQLSAVACVRLIIIDDNAPSPDEAKRQAERVERVKNSIGLGVYQEPNILAFSSSRDEQLKREVELREKIGGNNDVSELTFERLQRALLTGGKPELLESPLSDKADRIIAGQTNFAGTDTHNRHKLVSSSLVENVAASSPDATFMCDLSDAVIDFAAQQPSGHNEELAIRVAWDVLLYQRATLREIGDKLKISHTRVRRMRIACEEFLRDRLRAYAPMRKSN